MTETPRHAVNNFDLIRVIAALQVLVFHAIEHLSIDSLRVFGDWTSYLPGVPIFFVVSGFLISRSWERAPSARHYFANRLLRIYPALWVCLAVSIAIFLAAGVRPPLAPFAVWLAAQLTIGQFYNPDFLRGFGVGVVNGSLWTIVVELQFYIVLPLLALLARRIRGGWWWLAGLALVSMLVSRVIVGDRATITQKLLDVTLAPYLFFFLVGVVGQRLARRYPGLFERRLLAWLAAYAVWIAVERYFLIRGSGGNQLNTISILLVGGVTLSAAFTMPHLSQILRGNDISYGVYIYHMPVINLLLFMGIAGVRGLALTLVLVCALALASWTFIERPALALKRYSARW